MEFISAQNDERSINCIAKLDFIVEEGVFCYILILSFVLIHELQYNDSAVHRLTLKSLESISSRRAAAVSLKKKYTE